jgi:hypothetical protein
MGHGHETQLLPPTEHAPAPMQAEIRGSVDFFASAKKGDDVCYRCRVSVLGSISAR